MIGAAIIAVCSLCPGPVVNYTVLHGVVFAFIGVLAAYLIASQPSAGPPSISCYSSVWAASRWPFGH